MNEFHRQTYLSAMGVDTYMPRFQLPFARVSIACEIQPFVEDVFSVAEQQSPNADSSFVQKPASVNMSTVNVAPVVSLIGNIFEEPKVSRTVPQSVSAADILAQLDSKPKTIEPFSLSIWRPISGLMVVDSRNIKLALPTEQLFQNIMRSFFPGDAVVAKEEVLRWPAIENSFAKRSAGDARNELQTWLSVQHEIRPIKHLLLMGSNAATYLLPDETLYPESLFKKIPLLDSSINALILPSLNELLQKPISKKQLQSVLCKYLVAPQ